MLSNCPVCGLPKRACLHQRELKEDKYDRRVTRLVWFGFGFGVCTIVSLLLM